MNEGKFTLSAAQEKAVAHRQGPLLVVAGAGTGKTRVITERIRRLHQEEDLTANEILALTFTDKSAQEMVDRLDMVMPLGYEEPWINTFHGFADRLLKEEGLEIGLDTSYKILSSSDQWLLLRKNLFSFDLDYFRPLGNPTRFISALLRFISRLQDEHISVEQFEAFANHFEGALDDKKRWVEIAKVYKKYSAIKIKESKMDFADLITWTIKLFSDRPNILQKYKNQFKHILVDEFQDTNYAQYVLIKQLFPPGESNENRSLLVVGDDSQSIYKFRGAAISNILEFKNDFPQAEMLTLIENYRSNQKILDASYSLIQNNNPDTLESKLNISKELVSKVDPQVGDVAALVLESLDNEVDFVLKKIQELLSQNDDYTYRDIAILARANGHLDPFVIGLKRAGVPYQLVGNRGLYDTEEVRDVIALLRFLVNTEDSTSLYRVLNIATLEIPPSVISAALGRVKSTRKSFWDVIKDYNEDASVEAFISLIESYQSNLTKLSPVNIVHALIKDISYIAPLVIEETIENKLKIKNLNIFLEHIKNFERSYKDDTKIMPTLVDFMDHLDMVIEAGENPAQAEIEDVDTVNLLTVHASKGLEFKAVFMVNLVSDRFPTRNRSDAIEIPEDLIKETLPIGNAHIQEERRLFYVGMTRAQEYLYMLGAKNYGGKREKKISGYVQETGVSFEGSMNEESLQESLENDAILQEFFKAKEMKPPENKSKTISYSAFSDYKICPLRYKYSYALNIPKPPSHTLVFGDMIHATLSQFHSLQVAKKEVSLEEFLSLYEKNWQPVGFIDKEHVEARFESGKALLRKYYENNKVLEKIPVGIEQAISLKLDHTTKLLGRIDRIDPLDVENEVEIIDYKTGTPKTQKEVDNDDQMTLYALAVRDDLGYTPKKMTLYYLETGEVFSTTRTEEQIDLIKEELLEVVSEINASNFEPRPGYHCSYCDFKDICPFAQKI